MRMLFTFSPARAGPSHQRFRRSAIAFAAMTSAVALPVWACDNTPSRSIAGTASTETQIPATFTGEFVNGAPVYRLPAITVVSRRATEIARTQRENAQAPATRSRPSAPGPAG